MSGAGAEKAASQISPRFALDMTLGVFLAAMVALSAPWTSGRLVIPWDAQAHFYPQLAFLSQALHRGEAPFWNPFIFAGHPQIADPQSLIFSPLFLALAALVENPPFAAFDAAVFAHLAMGGVGIILYGRDRGWREPAALIAALAFAFGGAAIWRVQHVGQVVSLSFLPLALWALARALRRESFGWGLVAGLFAGLMALGRDQVALLGLWALAGYALAVWLARAERARFSLAPLIGGALAGAAVVAIPVLMTAAFAAMSNRPEIALSEAGKGSLHPASLLSFFAANLFGVDGPLKNFWGPPSPLWGPTDLYLARNMTALYQGALVAGLTLSAPLIGVLRRPGGRYALIGLALATLYALGRYTPFYAAIYAIPGADLFRRPADATFLIGFFAALTAGEAADRWLTLPRERGRLAGRVTLALGAGLAGAMVWLAQDKGTLALARPALLGAAFAYACAALAFWLTRRLAPVNRLLALLVAALALGGDLALSNGPNESTALPPQNFAALDPRAADPLVKAIAARLAEPVPPGRRDRVELAAIDFHWPNVAMVRRWESDLGYNPLRLALFTRVTGAGDHVALADQRQWAPAFASYRSPMADLIGLRWIVTGAPLSKLDHSLADDAFPVVAKVGDVSIYDRGAPAPRVAMLSNAKKIDFDRLITTGDWPAFDPSRTALFDRAESAVVETGADAPPGAARIAAYRDGEVIVDVEAKAPGWLILRDVYHPWWAAEVDGIETPVLRADVMFRAVAVPAGDHRVRFVFRPFAGLARDLLAAGLRRLDPLARFLDRGLETPASEARVAPADAPARGRQGAKP